ncbi:MAG: metallophosphoesterase [Planctomycetes bacterium]|nr:metallophosphoesterase [Planctomycetota bacterium]
MKNAEWRMENEGRELFLLFPFFIFQSPFLTLGVFVSLWPKQREEYGLSPLCAAAMIAIAILPGLSACSQREAPPSLPNEQRGDVPAGFTLLARFAHISDAQIIDEQSPARVPQADDLVTAAWRPQEAYSTQLLDGMIRAINREHEHSGTMDFVLHTGDATDNNQANEWRWFVDAFDGLPINPLTGPDDRAPGDIPAPELDPHAPFTPAGLYREGLHGPLPSIPWYAVIGNHDRFAIGVFPIFEYTGAARLSPLPLVYQLVLFYPIFLNPEADRANGPISPAHPGPLALLNLPQFVEPNPQRRYLSTAETIAVHFDTLTDPPGHGFVDSQSAQSWYSVSPVDGLRLIVLDTALPRTVAPMLPHHNGTLSAEQFTFLTAELQRAEEAGEWIIVASHHPSADLVQAGTETTPLQLRALLSSHSNVVLHLVGHFHRHRVFDRGGYLEIETGAIIDYPQEGRIIEIWQNATADEVLLRYHLFSHLDVEEVERDAMYELRQRAFELARADAGLSRATVQRRMSAHQRAAAQTIGAATEWLAGQQHDRTGQVVLSGKRNPK